MEKTCKQYIKEFKKQISCLKELIKYFYEINKGTGILYGQKHKVYNCNTKNTLKELLSWYEYRLKDITTPIETIKIKKLTKKEWIELGSFPCDLHN